MFTHVCILQHYLAERRVSTFHLVNLTKVSTASFSRSISALGGVGGPERTEMFVGSPVRTHVLVVGTSVSTLVAGVEVVDAVVGASGVSSSSSSSVLVSVNGTFVDFPSGYRYL